MLLFLFSESFLPYLLKTNPFHFPLQQSCFKMSIKGFQICEIVFPRIKLIPNVHSPSWIKSIKLMKPEVNKHKKHQSNKKEHWLWRYHHPMMGWPCRRETLFFWSSTILGEGPPAQIISDIFSTASFLQNQLLVFSGHIS